MFRKELRCFRESFVFILYFFGNFLITRPKSVISIRKISWKINSWIIGKLYYELKYLGNKNLIIKMENLHLNLFISWFYQTLFIWKRCKDLTGIPCLQFVNFRLTKSLSIYDLLRLNILNMQTRMKMFLKGIYSRI